jgi:hypothetical protein
MASVKRPCGEGVVLDHQAPGRRMGSRSGFELRCCGWSERTSTAGTLVPLASIPRPSGCQCSGVQ